MTGSMAGRSIDIPPRPPAGLYALSIMQPWAYCIVAGYKPVENRNWPTKMRGRILIHAGQKFDRAGYLWIKQNFPAIRLPSAEAFKVEAIIRLPATGLGGIVGVADLTDCVTEHSSKWFFGEYGFVFKNPRPLPFIPLRGQLGFFKTEIRP